MPAQFSPARFRGRTRVLGAALAVLGCAALALAGWQYRQGYHFRSWKPNEWWLRARGVYRYDPVHHIVRQGAAGVPMVALTFDDGPHPTSAALLDILRRHDARATFFLVGRNVKADPDTVRRMAAEGHELANHSHSHQRLPGLAERHMRNEIRDATTVIGLAAEKRARLFRPPGGQYTDQVTAEAARQGLLTVLWSSNTGDWQARNPRWIVNRALSNVRNGDIILLHEDHPETLQAMPAILEGLKARGLRAVTVSEMLAASGITPPPLPAPPARPDGEARAARGIMNEKRPR